MSDKGIQKEKRPVIELYNELKDQASGSYFMGLISQMDVDLSPLEKKGFGSLIIKKLKLQILHQVVVHINTLIDNTIVQMEGKTPKSTGNEE